MPDIIDNNEELDCNALKNKIKDVLRRYFPYDDNGDPNEDFDDYCTAQNVVDEIYDIVGGI